MNATVNIDVELNIAGKKFTLYTAVCHKGTETMGHYYTLHREQKDVWTQLDDETISRPLTDDAAQEMLAPFAYLLVYKLDSLKQTNQ